MAQNRIKNNNSPKPITDPRRKRPSMFSGLNLNAFFLFNNIHFIFYLAFLGIIYIANSHYSMKTIKEISTIQKELEKISWESNSHKSDLMFESMESNVAKKVQHLGLAPLNENPKRIVIAE